MELQGVSGWWGFGECEATNKSVSKQVKNLSCDKMRLSLTNRHWVDVYFYVFQHDLLETKICKHINCPSERGNQ